MPDEDFYESEIMRPARKLISILDARIRDLREWVQGSAEFGPVDADSLPELHDRLTRIHLVQVRTLAAAAAEAIGNALGGKEGTDVLGKLEG